MTDTIAVSADALDCLSGAICNYVNGCSDPYEPVSKWDAESERNFEALCRAYNDLAEECFGEVEERAISRMVAKMNTQR